MTNENGKITIKSIWKWLRSESGKRWSFVIFYLFFFIFIFILLSLPGSITDKSNNNTNESSLPFKTINLESSTYNFNYAKEINEETTVYLGRKENNNITLTKDDETITYTYLNGVLKPSNTDDTDIFYQLLDVYELKRIFKTSKYISKMELIEDNSLVYNYEITNQKLAELLNIEIFANQELINQIKVVFKNNNVDNITFDLLNLINNSNTINATYNSYKIIITYGEKNE